LAKGYTRGRRAHPPAPWRAAAGAELHDRCPPGAERQAGARGCAAAERSGAQARVRAGPELNSFHVGTSMIRDPIKFEAMLNEVREFLRAECLPIEQQVDENDVI